MLHLLPEYHKQQVVKEYKSRVLTIFSIGVLILVLISSAFLIPVYMSTHGRYSAVMQQKKEMELQISKRENNDDAEKVKEIVSAVEILKKYKMKELPSEVMTRIIRDKPRGVTVLGFIYTPPANQIESTEELSTIDISGVASTRVALSQFSETLKKDKVFKSVFIPISSFAKDKNIAFTVKLTISKNPSDWSYQDGSALSSTSTAQ